MSGMSISSSYGTNSPLSQIPVRQHVCAQAFVGRRDQRCGGFHASIVINDKNIDKSVLSILICISEFHRFNRFSVQECLMVDFSAVPVSARNAVQGAAGVDVSSVTEAVATTFAQAQTPRMAALLPMLVRHAHAFSR